MIRNRIQPLSIVIEKELYIVGGDMVRTANILGSIEKYDKINNKFVFITNFVKKRFKMSCCGFLNKIYIFGGSDSGISFNTWDVYDTHTNEWISTNKDITTIPGRPKGIKSAVAVSLCF